MDVLFAGLFVLYIELADGSVKRFWEWDVTVKNHADCQAAAAWWRVATGRWASCDEEL